MKSLLFRYCQWALALLLMSVSPVLAVASEIQHPTNERKAQILWEQAINAKGGRDRLNTVRSLVMSYDETVRNFLGIVVHRGRVERLYAFPDKSWAWDDGLPPPFRRTLGSLDIEKNLRCRLSDSTNAPACGPAKQENSPADEGLIQVQCLYLMETAWVKPTPYDVTTDRIGLKKVDVVHTRFGDKRIDYYLDRKTHLPVRVALFYGSGNHPLTIDISDYAPVAGIQMPRKQKRGRITFLINPDFDDGIFVRPLSFRDGPKAWQPRQY
jgi:hypothetical protein